MVTAVFIPIFRNRDKEKWFRGYLQKSSQIMADSCWKMWTFHIAFVKPTCKTISYVQDILFRRLIQLPDMYPQTFLLITTREARTFQIVLRARLTSVVGNIKSSYYLSFCLPELDEEERNFSQAFVIFTKRCECYVFSSLDGRSVLT